MKVVHGWESAPPGSPRTVATLGNFDGVHRGHRLLLDTTVRRAKEEGLTSAAITFFPHPATVVAPHRAPLALCSLDDRISQLAASGLDECIVLPFDDDFASMEAEAFIENVLVHAARLQHLILGPDARFGFNRRGDAAMLRHLGPSLGFSVEQLTSLTWRGERISSSRVRHAVAEGRVGDAQEMLGRPFRMSGTVVRGDQRGRILGFPTANLVPPEGIQLPAHGVYRASALVHGQPEPLGDAAVNVGVRPTFDGAKLLIEVHILDYGGDLYGQLLHVDLLERLRGELRFASVDELVTQLERDVEATRARRAAPHDEP